MHTHTYTFSQNTHTGNPISGLWELIIFPDEWCHKLLGRSLAIMSLCDVRFEYMDCRDTWAGGDRKTRQQLTHGAQFWSLGHHIVCLWRF